MEPIQLSIGSEEIHPAPPAAPIHRFQLQLSDLLLWSIYLGGILYWVPFTLILKAHFSIARLFVLALLFLLPMLPAVLIGLTTANGRHLRGMKRLLCWLVLFAPLAIAQTGIAKVFSHSMLQRQIVNQYLATIQFCENFRNVQDAYRRTDWDNDGTLEYANSLKKLSDAGLISTEMAAAEGPDGIPYEGYLFKILTSQGSTGPGGATDFYNGKHLTKGAVIVAVPFIDPEIEAMGVSYPGCYMISIWGSDAHHHIDFKDSRKFLGTIQRFDYQEGCDDAVE